MQQHQEWWCLLWCKCMAIRLSNGQRSSSTFPPPTCHSHETIAEISKRQGSSQNYVPPYIFKLKKPFHSDILILNKKHNCNFHFMMTLNVFALMGYGRFFVVVDYGDMMFVACIVSSGHEVWCLHPLTGDTGPKWRSMTLFLPGLTSPRLSPPRYCNGLLTVLTCAFKKNKKFRTLLKGLS